MQIEISKEINGQLLHEELAAAYPALVTGDALKPYLFELMYYPDGKTVLEMPDGVDEKAAQAVIDAHDAKRPDRRTRIRQMVLNAASGAAGKNVKSLTTAEQRALLACLLFRAGAIDENGIVQPLEDWIGG